MPIDVAVAMREVQLAEKRALESVADYIVQRAKERAPVREVERKKRKKIRKVRINSAEGRAMIRAYARISRDKTFADIAKYKFLAIRVQRRGTKRQPYRIGTVRSIKVSDYKREILGSPQSFRSRRGIGASQFREYKPNSKPLEGFTVNDATSARNTSSGNYEIRSGRAITLTPIEHGGKEIGTAIAVGGRLKKSIAESKVKRTKRGLKISVGTDVEYARYVEFPTSHNAAQPFLLPALKDGQRVAKQAFEGALKERGLKKG